MRRLSSLAFALALIPVAGCTGDDGSGNDTSNQQTATGGSGGSGGDGATGADDGTGGDGATGADGATAADTATGGDGADTGSPSGGYCLHQCMSDSDCTIMGAGDATCGADGMCTAGGATGCSDDTQCQAQYSGWVTPCTSGGGECDATMQVCVDVGGDGLCATPPSMFIDCATLMMDELDVMDIDGNAVTVCGNSTATCGDDGICFDPCQSDDDCAAASAPSCNTDTGMCECSQDSDCASLGMANLSVCNNGVCGCGEDQNCVDGNVGDVCNDGACGCSNDNACANVDNPYDGGTIACVQL